MDNYIETMEEEVDYDIPTAIEETRGGSFMGDTKKKRKSMLSSVMGFRSRQKGSVLESNPLEEMDELGRSQTFGGMETIQERNTELPPKVKHSITSMFKKKASELGKQAPTPSNNIHRSSTINIQKDLKEQVTWQHKPYC